MKRLLILLLLVCIVPNTYAGDCSYRSSYSSSYWPGGYWSGGGGYSSGYYSSGYYRNYQSNYYEQPTFYKFRALIPLVELPTYGAYVQPVPPVAPTVGPTPTYAPTAVSADAGKLDRLLQLTEQTTGRMTRIETRLDVLEGKTPLTPPANAPVTPPAKETSNVPSILHGRCAVCHEAKAVATAKSKVTLFVSGPNGDEMASVNAKGETEPLSLPVLKKIEKVLADSTMPPDKDATGNAVAAMLPDERKESLNWVRRILSGGK